MAFKNLIDDTSTTVSASTPGVYLDLRQHSTLNRAALGVPVRMWVYAASTVASDTGVVIVLDSLGAIQLTVPITGTAEQWYAIDGWLPATDAKYDAHYGGNTLGTLSVYDFTIEPFGLLGANEGEMSASIGEITLVAEGLGLTGELSQSIGNITIAADGLVAYNPPAYQAVGTSAGGAGTVSPAWPTHAVDDVAILLVATFKSGSDPGAATLSDAQGFSASIVSDLTTGGFGDGYRLTAFWHRATSTSMAAPTVADAHDGVNAVIITIRGCVASGSPIDVTSSAANATSNTSGSIAGATTTAANCIVLAAFGYTGTATTGSWTNADLTSLTERIDDDNTEHVAVATGTKATSGAYGATTATLSAAEFWTGITIALKP